MTAFARAEATAAGAALVWELRSVNHRYLELSLRLPEELRALEPAVREQIGLALARGKVDATLRIQHKAAPPEAPRLDPDALARLFALADEVRRRAHGELAPLTAADVLRWPGVVLAPEADADALARAARAALAAALEQLDATRRREGARLAEVIGKRLDAVEATVTQARAIWPEVVPQYRERLRARIAELGVDAAPERLEQEIVLYAQRADVDEELERLVLHAAETRRVLVQGGPVGRRLDFLMQELNREANTLASKSADARLTAAATELKVLIEQIREQVQNVE